MFSSPRVGGDARDGARLSSPLATTTTTPAKTAEENARVVEATPLRRTTRRTTSTHTSDTFDKLAPKPERVDTPRASEVR